MNNIAQAETKKKLIFNLTYVMTFTIFCYKIWLSFFRFCFGWTFFGWLLFLLNRSWSISSCAAKSISSCVISNASCISIWAQCTNSGSQYLPNPCSKSTYKNNTKTSMINKTITDCSYLLVQRGSLLIRSLLLIYFFCLVDYLAWSVSLWMVWSFLCQCYRHLLLWWEKHT